MLLFRKYTFLTINANFPQTFWLWENSKMQTNFSPEQKVWAFEVSERSKVHGLGMLKS